jgi:hypothetical protein
MKNHTLDLKCFHTDVTIIQDRAHGCTFLPKKSILPCAQKEKAKEYVNGECL